MKPNLHILCTVRKPELLPAALLVFGSLRIGFPTAEICVWGNQVPAESAATIHAACTRARALWQNLPATSHDAWLEQLIHGQTRPCWICDTDLVFWENVEGWFDETEPLLFAGRFEPEFNEPWTRTRHIERLHTALAWIQPGILRSAMRAWMAKIPLPWRNSAQYPFIRQTFVPQNKGPTLFYDTLAGAYQALGGRSFTEAQDAAFDHLHAGTYADVIKLPGADLSAVHQAIYRDPSLARGMQQQQNEWYARHAPKGTDV